MTDLLSFFMKSSVIRKIRSNTITGLEPAVQFVSEGDEKREGSAAPWAEDCSWPCSEELLSPCRGTQHTGMPCQAPHLAVPSPGHWSLWLFHIWTGTSDVEFCDVPNTPTKRRPTWCWHHALNTNSKINSVGTNSVSPGLFLLPPMSLALIQFLLINFHQI